jgi:hypothetical protein
MGLFKRDLNVAGTSGRADASHIPVFPLWVVILRIVQLVLAFIILVLAAFSASKLSVVWSGHGMAFFTFSWTILYLAYLAVSTRVVPLAYNMWAHIGLESLTVLWWLVTWALLASEAAGWDWIDDYYTGYTYGIDGGDYYPSDWKAAINCVKGAAALGAFEWVSFVVTLVFLGIAVHRTRTTGNSAPPPAFNGDAGGPPPMEQHTMQPQMPQQYYQPQQTV